MFFLLVLGALFLVVEMYELPEFIRISLKRSELQAEVERLRMERDSLRIKLEKLNDKEEIERLARIKLGMIKKGEKVLIIK
ncbi:septum formation initiator [bacterium]|nr:MAG: septum formation initiator [bacterium]